MFDLIDAVGWDPEKTEEITTDRLAIGALDRLFQKYARAIRA